VWRYFLQIQDGHLKGIFRGFCGVCEVVIMSLDNEEAVYDACHANEIRFFKIDSRNHAPSRRQNPEYVFFSRYAGICYLVAGGLGVALQTLLIFWFIARCFG
jgi:hypothetical protein